VQLLTERYQGQIAGVLSCYDRIIIQGTLPKWCYAKGMTDYCYEHQIRIFDYPKWAEPLRDAIRQNMERIAAANGTEIVFIRSKKKFRQEKHVRPVLDQRGEEPGVVWILSAMEPGSRYQPWHDQKTHKTYLKPDDGNACTTTSISSTRIWACVTCGCRPGVPSGSSSIAMATVIWPGS